MLFFLPRVANIFHDCNISHTQNYRMLMMLLARGDDFEKKKRIQNRAHKQKFRTQLNCMHVIAYLGYCLDLKLQVKYKKLSYRINNPFLLRFSSKKNYGMGVGSLQKDSLGIPWRHRTLKVSF